MAQSSIIFSLVGRFGAKALMKVYSVLFVVWVLLGLLLNKLLKGSSPELFLEIPPYRLPYGKAVLKKLWIRIKWFLKDAVPYVLLGVLIANTLYVSGFIHFLDRISSPLVVGWLGLPEEAVVGLFTGFLRKDIATGMLLPVGLNEKQSVVASVVLSMYFPCMATFVVMLKELGLIDTIKATSLMMVIAFTIGGLVNLLF